MTLFEFLTVAVCIVLGLGLVRLMDGLGGVLRSPSRYWIHLAVLLGLIACHLFYWWSLWSFHEYPDWNFFRFTYVIFGALLLYLAASALVPRDMDSVRSWKEHYFRVHRSLYLAIACYVVQQVLAPAVMRHRLSRTPLSLAGSMAVLQDSGGDCTIGLGAIQSSCCGHARIPDGCRQYTVYRIGLMVFSR